jgi:hypothetical protein
MQATRILKAISFISLAIIANNSFANEPTDLPSPFTAKYEAFRHDKDIGTAKLTLSPLDDGTYELNYESKVSRFFLSDKRYETSKFSFKDGEITPISYRFSRKGTGPNKSLNATFDSSSKTIIIDEEENIPWAGEFDNQLFRIDISRQLAQNKKEFEYKFLNYRGQKRSYRIEVVETELLELPYGKLEAIKVKVNRESNKRETFAWFAPTLDHVLVRLQQFKDDEEQGDIRLKSYNKK